MSFSRNDFRQIISKLLKSDLEPEKIMPGRDREEEPLDVENRSGIEIRISAASDTINFATERDCLTVEPGANPDDIQSRAENIGSNVLSHAYQLVLFLITQSGYLVVVASMLSTNFFEPSKSTCDAITAIATNNTFPDIEGHQKILGKEFHSLLVEWQEECSGSRMTIYVSTAVMLGAIFGSFGCGYLADRLGRKPVVVGCMLALCLGNAIIGLLGGINRVFAVIIFFILGSASGGYIVTNMVFIVEAVSDSRTRLLVVSLNGWPAGMVFTAILGWLTQNWRIYHLTCSALSIICVTFLECFCKESIRWLLERGDTLRAMKIHTEIQRQYERCCKRPQEINKSISPSPSFSPKTPDENSNTEVNNAQRPPRKYSYLDLFRHKSISVPLLVLVYCFFSSSVVSFGLIFSAEVLPGDRYLNLAGMGLGKLVLGLVPYMVSRWFGRRPIILVSVGVACVSCGALILTWTLFRDSAHWLITALGLSLVAAMDPTWKINHLYSMELFPTAVRNMARGVCSVMSRVGSDLPADVQRSRPILDVPRAADRAVDHLIFFAAGNSTCRLTSKHAHQKEPSFKSS
ncbi:major facilitator superfamily domain-containing protein [Ditylenchus destructor]|nr:major facilitator superfamily domain-containing protein [Ditylenchus destructor]